jgi:hypothetical protein
MKTRKLVPLPSPITKSVSFSSNRRVVYDIIKIKYVDYDVWFSQENTNNVAFEYNGKLTGYDLTTIDHNIKYVKCKKINNILLKKHTFNSKVKYINLPLINNDTFVIEEKKLLNLKPDHYKVEAKEIDQEFLDTIYNTQGSSLNLKQLQEDDIFKDDTNKKYRIALAFYTAFYQFMKTNIKKINLDIVYRSHRPFKTLKDIFGIEQSYSTNEINAYTFYEKIVQTIKIQDLIDEKYNIMYMSYKNRNTNIKVHKIIPFLNFFDYSEDFTHINELLVYFEYDGKFYFLYLRLTFYYNIKNNIAIYPLLFEPLTNFSSIDDEQIKQHIRIFSKKQIDILDNMFWYYSKISKGTNKVLYRGMTKKYLFSNTSFSKTINEFISVSKNIEIAKEFGSKVLYKIILCKGTPYIDNSRITVLPEDEIILPRGIVLKINEKYKENMKYETINGVAIPVIKLYASYNNEKLLDKTCKKKTIVKIINSNSSQSTNALSATNISGTY